ncbi:META domain-containing protein [Microbacterium pseudoresistens]|uniref:Heat shock protein HslJ n=1 Tax=Microbacterium pseudoresistens TaxID=640634 RepID=A0A7Y9JMN0_9MICO|nr:META domain-containing protein [Microbacterium pseudoresistens]NYD54520.1 heat shock protein HslJ [Microbacterium pseudoresistens]
MRIKTTASTVLFASGMLLLAGCASTAGGASTPTEVPEPSEAPSSAPTLVSAWQSTQTGEPKLSIYDDGTFAANDGCNAFNGTYAQNGDALDFTISVGTQKGCPDIDTWLEHIDTATVADTTLQVFDAEGTAIGTLDAKK